MASPGQSSKCSYSEFSDTAQAFVGKYRRNIHRAIVGDSPYKLALLYSHLEVCKEEWHKLSKMQRISRILLLVECSAKEYAEDPFSLLPSTTQILPDFECSGLPKVKEETWSKAEVILEKKRVTNVQATTGISVVISTSKPNQPHIINKVNGSVKCDCEAFKSGNICSHVITVVQRNDELQELQVKWEPNLCNLVQSLTRTRKKSAFTCTRTGECPSARRPLGRH